MDPSIGGGVNPHFQPGMQPGPGQMMPQQQHGAPPGMYQQGHQPGQGQDPSMMNPSGMMSGGPVGGHGPMIPTTIPPGGQPPPNLPFANLSTSQVTKLGMEQVQEIVAKTAELFTIFRSHPIITHQLSAVQQEERKAKIAEVMNRINLLFKRLRKIYEKVSEETSQMEFVQIEHLIPLKKPQVNGSSGHRSLNGDSDSGSEKKDTEAVQENVGGKSISY